VAATTSLNGELLQRPIDMINHIPAKRAHLRSLGMTILEKRKFLLAGNQASNRKPLYLGFEIAVGWRQIDKRACRFRRGDCSRKAGRHRGYCAQTLGDACH
jgi:hypothetical protein